MTSPSHRNRPTTACGPRRPLRTAASLSGLVLLLTAGAAFAQGPAPGRPTFTFHKPAEAPDSRPAPVVPAIYFHKPAGEPGAIVPAAMQALQPPPPVPGGRPGPGEPLGFQIQLDPPGPDRLFRLESEAALNERMRQEARGRVPPERITFPDEPVLSKDRYTGRAWPKFKTLAEPQYVCYGRLFFEQKNEERYGWDLGIIEPVVSAGHFFADFVTLPYHMASYPCRKYECSAGYCLPGQPVPYMLYPPEVTVTGTVAEGAVIGTLLAIFP